MAPHAAISQYHDIVVVGASAGGVEALQSLFRGLPAELPASVFVVLHIGRTPSYLPEILTRAGPLPVAEARGGERVERGRVYVAPPDRHLLLHDDHVLVRRGPHENMARPAIDPLFRSAACNFGSRVIGIVLSGALNDGTAGLLAVKRCGGIAVIQEPADAAVPSMPRSAQRYVAIDHVLPAAAMGRLVTHLVASRAGPTPQIPPEIRLEALIAAQELEEVTTREKQLGHPSPFGCPECGGTLWQLAEDNMLRYRCHLGHGYTAEAMLAVQSDGIERLLTRLWRSHRDRSELTRRMAEQERSSHRDELAEKLEARARDYDRNAALMQRLLVSHDEALYQKMVDPGGEEGQ